MLPLLYGVEDAGSKRVTSAFKLGLCPIALGGPQSFKPSMVKPIDAVEAGSNGCDKQSKLSRSEVLRMSEIDW